MQIIHTIYIVNLYFLVIYNILQEFKRINNIGIGQSKIIQIRIIIKYKIIFNIIQN